MRTSISVGVALAALLLAGCGSDNAGVAPPPISSPAPAPPVTQAPAPSPSPSPSPTPTPPPTPAPGDPSDDGKTVIVAEGDSISYDWVGNYTGYFRVQHPAIEYHGLAVSGSTIKTIAARADAALALNPDIVTVFVGANDLGGYPSAQAFVAEILAYAEPFRSRGAKVLVATVLPRQTGANATWDNNHNLLRPEVASLLQEARSNEKIDGIIDFGGDPVVGQIAATGNLQLYKDGLHPTDIGWNGSIGGHDYLYEIYSESVEPFLDQ